MNKEEKTANYETLETQGRKTYTNLKSADGS